MADLHPVVCFGEILLRLGPPLGVRLADAARLDCHVGGAEANVAVALAGMGHRARMVSLVPDDARGDRAVSALAGAGVDCAGVARGAGRMGLYWLEPGGALRPGRVIYDRAFSAFAMAQPGVFDFAAAFAGASVLHLSGITAALGPGGVALARAAVTAARAAGLAISFDPNYRALLWQAWDSDPRAILTELVEQADILFANHRDMALLLGGDFADSGASDRRACARAAFAAFPRLRVMASTRREVREPRIHDLLARVDTRDAGTETAPVTIPDIVDRVGSGDAFAAGVLSAWLDGDDAVAMAQRGLALGALKHGQQGDLLRVTRREVAEFTGRSDDVRR